MCMYIFKKMWIHMELWTKYNSLRDVHPLVFMCSRYCRSYIHHVIIIIVVCKYMLACNKDNFAEQNECFHNDCNKCHLNLYQWPHMNSHYLLPSHQHQPPTEILLRMSHLPLLHNEGAFSQTAYQFITSSVCECTFGSFGCSINVMVQPLTVNAVSWVFKSYDVTPI